MYIRMYILYYSAINYCANVPIVPRYIANTVVSAYIVVSRLTKWRSHSFQQGRRIYRPARLRYISKRLKFWTCANTMMGLNTEYKSPF